MKRRTALRQLAIFSSGMAILPSCDLSIAKVYENVPIERRQRKFLARFLEYLLPTGEEPILRPEPVLDFVLTVLNDCHSPEDIARYLMGLKELELYIDQQFNHPLHRLPEAGQQALFDYLSKAEAAPEATIFFHQTTMSLSQRHFITSKYFMTTLLDYEFIPGRFLGCVDI